jgi:hypothetical protein
MDAAATVEPISSPPQGDDKSQGEHASTKDAIHYVNKLKIYIGKKWRMFQKTFSKQPNISNILCRIEC